MQFEVCTIGMTYPTLAHAQTNHHVSQFGHWYEVNADTEQMKYTYWFSTRYIVTNVNLPIHSSGDAGAVTISWSESAFYMVISFRCNLQWLTFTDSGCFDFWMVDEAGAEGGGRDGMHSCVWCFHEHSLIWLVRGREVRCGICDFPGTLSRVSIGSPTVVSAEEAASSAVWGWTTAWTLNAVIPCFLSLSRNKSDGSPQPGCVNLWSFICFCWKRSLWCLIVSEIVPITQPGSSSSLSLPSSGSDWSSSSFSPSSPSFGLARSLKLSPIAFNICANVVSGFVVVNTAFSAFLISSCSCSIDISVSSTRFLATVVSHST